MVLSELRTVVLPSMVHWYTSGVAPVAVQVRMMLSPVTAGSTPSILTSGSSERLRKQFKRKKKAILTDGPTAQNINRLSPVVN